MLNKQTKKKHIKYIKKKSHFLIIPLIFFLLNFRVLVTQLLNETDAGKLSGNYIYLASY